MSVLLSAVALPFLKPPAPIDIGVPIQVFGMIVAAGVLIGAALLRRYAEWHGISDEHIRGLTGWITVAGFIGAHEFDVLAYQWDRISEPIGIWPPSHWPLIIRFWDGISSYGGFVGGAVGFALYVWWKRLPVRLYADTAVVGLLPAFSIGRIGCTVVSDHIGAAVDTAKWYAALAMDYPRNLNMAHLAEHYPGTSEYIRAWNLGLIEFLYLVPVNAFILWLAFRKKRHNSGMIAVLAGLLYSPVRFFLDFLRPEETDPRHLGLTFAQWAAIAAFGIAAYVMARVLQNGKTEEVVAPTSGEAQRRLKLILREEASAADAKKPGSTKPAAKPEPAKPAKPALVETVREDKPDPGDDAGDDDEPSEAEDKAAAADDTEGDEGVDDAGTPASVPKPDKAKAAGPKAGEGARKGRGGGGGGKKKKR